MCGIVGFTNMKNHALIRAMNDSQIHRGPDDEGYYFCEKSCVNMAMRRLSIIDLEGGQQPMSSADGNIWIVFNGEIFNAPELRQELADNGYAFRTDHSDTEVLIYLYAKYGTDMLRHLNGMFAFVIYDKQKQILFGARDHFGIKPLYYCHSGDRFAFASELKSLKVLPWITWEIDYQSLYHYFSFQCIPSPKSIYRSVSKLAAANCFTLNLSTNDLNIRSYWKPKFAKDGDHIPPGDVSQYVLYELKQAVQRWSLSDVPVACSLSGGIDSSAIVALMSKQRNICVKTYTLGFEDASDLDETDLARQVARKWNTEHHEICLKPDNLLDDLDQMVYHLDEPYAGGLPSWFVFKMMGQDVKVAMTGTGGDEVFGNYGKWKTYENPQTRLRAYLHMLIRLKSPMECLKYPVGSLYSIYFRDRFKRKSLFQAHIIQEMLSSSEELIEQLWQQSNDANPRNAVAFTDLHIQLPDEFLHMTDRFSMAHSIEARTPFLDRVFVERMFSIPPSVRTSQNSLKHLLINAVRDLLPSEVISSQKRGFILPTAQWLRTRIKPSVERLLCPEYLRKQGIFQDSIYKDLVLPHLNSVRDMSSHLWTLLMFQLWYERNICR